MSVFLFGDPYGNRTHDSTLRGWRLSRLTNGPFFMLIYYISNFFICQYYFATRLTNTSLKCRIIKTAQGVFSMKIKVIGFNIRYCDDKDGHTICERAPRLKEILSREKPDLIGFQECELPWEPILEQDYSNEYEIHLVHRAEKSAESTPILWRRDRFDCLEKGHFWLSDTPEVESRGWDERFNCYRICVWALLQEKSSSEKILFMNTHYGFGDKGQCDSADLIAARAKAIGGYPTLVTGDYNMKPTDAGYSRMTSHFTDSNAVTARDFSATFHGYEPEKYPDEHIDYCFVNDRITPVSYTVLNQTFDGKYPSDHYGLLLELDI